MKHIKQTWTKAFVLSQLTFAAQNASRLSLASMLLIVLSAMEEVDHYTDQNYESEVSPLWKVGHSSIDSFTRFQYQFQDQYPSLTVKLLLSWNST